MVCKVCVKVGGEVVVVCGSVVWCAGGVVWRAVCVKECVGGMCGVCGAG